MTTQERITESVQRQMVQMKALRLKPVLVIVMSGIALELRRKPEQAKGFDGTLTKEERAGGYFVGRIWGLPVYRTEREDVDPIKVF